MEAVIDRRYRRKVRKSGNALDGSSSPLDKMATPVAPKPPAAKPAAAARGRSRR